MFALAFIVLPIPTHLLASQNCLFPLACSDQAKMSNTYRRHLSRESSYVPWTLSLRMVDLVPPFMRKTKPSRFLVRHQVRKIAAMGFPTRCKELLRILFYWPELAAEIVHQLALDEKAAEKARKKKENEKNKAARKVNEKTAPKTQTRVRKKATANAAARKKA